ncbi:MAG: sulfatase-like hydrolase/transferase [Parachlamydiales bacterium]|jgi:hypothetical protein
MDKNILFGLNIFLSGGLENILITFRAINLNLQMSVLVFIGLLTIPFTGVLLYRYTKKLSQKKPLSLSLKHLLISIIILLIFQISLGLFCKETNLKNLRYIYKNEQKLPLFYSFLPSLKKEIVLAKNIKILKSENSLLDKINKINFEHVKRPNIYIFIVETLRKDFITKEIASNIYDFEKQNISFNKSYSAANASQISWYSIFHSKHPIFWSENNKNSKHGSLPLNILKKLDYKINVFTSAEMSYFHMNNLIFGENNSLANSYNDFSLISSDPSTRDNIVIDNLTKKILETKDKQSNVFITFLDSTHSEYSWPKDFEAKFSPYSDKINYITLSQDKTKLQLVKNRYKNSINFIDHLFGKFLTFLKTNNLYDDSIIVFTGDHGEEFFEDGSLFHSSHLNNYQIQVPIIFKLLNQNEKRFDISSHIDIFPTILSQLIPDKNFNDIFDGRSIFDKNHNPFIISVNQNGALTPNELIIIKDSSQLKGKFISKKNLVFRIDETINIDERNIENELQYSLDSILE